MYKAGVLIAAFLAVLNVAEGASCLQNLNTFKTAMEEQTTCVQKLNLTEAEVVTIDNLKEKHFNDHCLSNCTLGALKFIKMGGDIQTKTILEKLKSEASEEVYGKLSKVVEECAEIAAKRPTSTPKPEGEEKDSKSKDGKGRKHGSFRGGRGGCSCRKAAKFMYCMSQKDKDLC